jgi:hypothetical protein
MEGVFIRNNIEELGRNRKDVLMGFYLEESC